MVNNYEYVEILKKNKEEQQKTKQHLQNTLDILLISEEEKEQLLEKVIDNAIKSYTPKTILAFLPYVRNKLKREIDKTYFTPSSLIPIEEQKIIKLYLSKKDENFLSEEEIRKKLKINSRDTYRVIYKLENATPQIKQELSKMFPNYQECLKERKRYFKQAPQLSEKDLRYLGYYIGEIEDLCLEIQEIAKKEKTSIQEIEKSLQKTFQLLQQSQNLEIVKKRYPNCETMITIKKEYFKIYEQKQHKKNQEKIQNPQTRNKKKQITKVPKAQNQEIIRTKKSPTPSKHRSLTPKQIQVLEAINENPNQQIEELTKTLNYKRTINVYAIIYKIKKLYQKSEEAKQEILAICPSFQIEKSRKKEQFLTARQVKLLETIKKYPNKTIEELVKELNYKNNATLNKIIYNIRRQCKEHENIKQQVLTIFPDFPIEIKKKKKSLLTAKQRALLEAINENPNQQTEELVKILNCKNINNIKATIRKRCQENPEIKQEVLTICPTFPIEIKKKKKALLTTKQRALLEAINENPNQQTKELAKTLNYKSITDINNIKYRIRKNCQKKPEVKQEVLTICPTFPIEIKKKEKNSTPVKKSLLTKKQRILLETSNKYQTQSSKELAKILNYKSIASVNSLKKKIRNKSQENPEVKQEVLTICPTFPIEKKKKEKNSTPVKKSLLTRKQRILLETSNKYQTQSSKELAKILNYKSIASVNGLKKKIRNESQENPEVKQEILTICPTFPIEKKKKEKNSTPVKKSLLTRKQRILIETINENPTKSPNELAEMLNYKQKNSINTLKTRIQKKCQENEEAKKEVLTICPTFFEQKGPEKELSKKEKRLLACLKQQENEPFEEKETFFKAAGYQTFKSINANIEKLKQYYQNEKLREKIIEIFPDFFEKEIKVTSQNFKTAAKSSKEKETVTTVAQSPKEKEVLTTSQKRLLEELQKQKAVKEKGSILAKKVGYKSVNTLNIAIKTLKKKCQDDAKIKEEILKIAPSFLEKKVLLTEEEFQILQKLYLITPPETEYKRNEEIAKSLHIANSYLSTKKSATLNKINQNESLHTELQSIWPSFEEDKKIKENYKKTRSIKIPIEEVEKIKSFIRRFDIPNNEIEKTNNPILRGIDNLENSIFHSYISKCTEEQKAMLALRLGFINAPATTETIAELFKVEKEEVITLTKNCLQSVKKENTPYPTLPKQYRKKGS